AHAQAQSVVLADRRTARTWFQEPVSGLLSHAILLVKNKATCSERSRGPASSGASPRLSAARSRRPPLPRNEGVPGSSPGVGSTRKNQQEPRFGGAFAFR